MGSIFQDILLIAHLHDVRFLEQIAFYGIFSSTKTYVLIIMHTNNTTKVIQVILSFA